MTFKIFFFGGGGGGGVLVSRELTPSPDFISSKLASVLSSVSNSNALLTESTGL